MDVREMLRKGLQDLYGEREAHSLSTFLRATCLLREHKLLQTNKAEVCSPEQIMLDRAEYEIKQWAVAWFAGAYGPRFKRGGWRSYAGVHYLFLGWLDGIPVDMVLQSGTTYGMGRLGNAGRLRAAFVGAALKSDAVYVVRAHRSSMEWAAHTVSGCEVVGADLLHDASLLARWWEDDSNAIGTGSESDCAACVVADLCTNRVLTGPTLPPVRKLKVRPNAGLIKDLDRYLEYMNELPNHRSQGVTHPSEVAITSCDRRLWYELKHYERKEQIKPKLRRIFAIGHAYHAVIQVVSAHAIPDFLEEVRVTHKTTLISGSVDGDSAKLDAVFEYKSISELGFDGLTNPKSDHKKQATIYTKLRDRANTVYVYMNKETGDLRVFEKKFEKKLWHEIAYRLEMVVTQARNDVIPDQAEYADSVCASCPFQWTCKPHLDNVTGGF